MKYYANFLKNHKPDSDSSLEVNKAIIAKYTSVVKPGLIELWEELGFCSFHKGLFWLVNPDDWSETLENFGIRDGIAILRSSFGSIVYINSSGKVAQLTPILGKNIDIVDNLDFYFPGILSGKEYYKDAFINSLHKKALGKLGRINVDECYGFEPLLSLGGVEDVEYMVKVGVREHLALIAQTL